MEKQQYLSYLDDPALEIIWNVTKDGDTVLSTVKRRKIFMGDVEEQEAKIQVSIDDFIIRRATFSEGGKVFDIDSLKGVYGYIEGKKTIKDKLFHQPEIIESFLQCVSALIQGETYIYDKRGFLSKDDYNKYWDKLEEDGCRYYSKKRADIKSNDPKWMDYVPDNFSKTDLFHREKIYGAVVEDGKLLAMGYLNDTYHEMGISLHLNLSGEILDFNIDFFRAPGKACFTNNENNDALVGNNISQITKKDIIRALGGTDGCYHIVELAIELIGVINGSN